MKEETEKPIYARATLDFVATAARYCALLEGCEGEEREAFCAALRRLLPLLYAEATLLPRAETTLDFLPDDRVTEDDYNWVRRTAADIMGEDDEYELAGSDALAPDERRWASVSEGLADIYQALRNFVAVYQQRVEDCMADALWTVVENFELYWGEALVDTLRRLHQLRYGSRE